MGETETSSTGVPADARDLPAAPAAAPGAQGASAGMESAGGTVPQSDWIGRLLRPVAETRGWLKFLGVVMIGLGGLAALTIVGLIVAWLYVWVGVLLWQAGDRAGWATARRDPVWLEQYLEKLKTLILISGVVVAIHLVLVILVLSFLITLGGAAALLGSFF